MPYRIDSQFNVRELPLNMREPEQKFCQKISEMNYDVSFDGTHFNIKALGKSVKLEITDENLRKIRHEIVSNVMTFDTDEKLEIIGVKGEESGLTPDIIHIDDKKVLEVTTTAVPELFSLKNAYAGKEARYRYILDPLGFELAILVVSATSVYCNFEITQDTIDALCYRSRLGLALENIITETLGTDIFSEDLAYAEQMVLDEFRKITLIPNSELNFDVNEIINCASKPTNEDFRHTGKVLGKCLQEATLRSTETEAELKTYMESFNESNSRTSNKRVTNIPMILQDKLPRSNVQGPLDPNNAKMPSYMHTIWNQAMTVKEEKTSYEKIILESLDKEKFDRHRLQKSVAFNVKLPESERVEAAKAGLWGKEMDRNEEVQLKAKEDHKSFNPISTNTEDIESFLTQSLLTLSSSNCLPGPIGSLIEHTKSLWSGTKPSLSYKIFSTLCRSRLGKFGTTISKLMTEICYSYKYWIKRADFYHKTCDGIHMVIRTTGTHIFASFAYPKDGCEIIDTGRIGPQLFYSNNYIFSDFVSFNEPALEHFVKAGPYLIAIVAHLLSLFELPLDNMVINDKRVYETLNNILLLYLNNKTDVEELITSQRYFTMGILEELDPNPYRFVDRLPEVLRSRLTCHYVKRTINLMNHYAKKKIIKVPTKTSEDVYSDYTGLVSFFGNFDVSLRQKINEFYYGYVISKERGRGNDRNFQIMKKIVAEEYRFRDTVTRTLEKTMDPKIHVSDPIVMKVFYSMFKLHLKKILGDKYEMVVKREMIKHLAMANFTMLSTLKVASRKYQSNIIIPLVRENQSTSEIYQNLTKANPEEIEKRPRVLEAIASLVEAFVKDGNPSPRHPVQLLKYAMDTLNGKGYFDSDIFPKPQHGGDREIHVLEIMARIVQFHFESLAKSLCRLITSDTLTHPGEKENFVKKHYLKSITELGEQFTTLGKSADATKWCQRNHCSKFATVMVALSDKVFWPFVLQLMRLWQYKRISFPIQFAANFMSNKNVQSNPVYKRMQKEFESGTGIFVTARNNKMMIKSGMMQGILHYTSSIVHGVIQVVMADIQQKHLLKRGVQSVITIVQGSDDSAEIISLKGQLTKNKLRLATTMLHWKEKVSRWFSIYTSRAKSSIGTLDLVEYNSEWFVKNSVVKPTFRWVSASLENTVVEKFIDRLRTNYGTLTQVLEGGGKVLECAIIQMCQAWMHYMLLGLHNNPLASNVASMLFRIKDPALGFFPLDSDFCCGLTGVDFQLYHLYVTSEFGKLFSIGSLLDPDVEEASDETSDMSISKELQSVRLKFGNLRLWHNMIRRMKVPELEKLIEEVENNPYLIFVSHSDWDSEKYQIYLKVFQPGVKESISSFSPVARLMSASAYMINRPCISIRVIDGDKTSYKKVSLFKALLVRVGEVKDKKKDDVNHAFIHSEEYKEVKEYIEDLEMNHTIQKQSLRSKSKQKIMVFERHLNDVNISDLCKKFWLGVGKLPLSKRQISLFWENAKVKYWFLRDSLEETKEVLRMSTIEIKNYLESLDSKPRYVTLLDTTAKSGTLYNTMTRVFWANSKILLPGSGDEDESSYSLRSKMFSILTSFFSDASKRKFVVELLRDSTLLRKKQMPNRIKKLKVIRDWILSKDQSMEDKQKVLTYIREESLGSVGFFTIRQGGYGVNRKGPGEWRGSCVGTPAVISMRGNVCTGITVSTLANQRDLGLSLLELVRGMSLIATKRPVESTYWLNPSGKIVGGHGKAEYIPIIIEKDLNIEIMDQVADHNWVWELTGCKLRLVSVLDKDTQITMVVENFSAYDWDPAFHDFEDQTLSDWAEGKPISLNKVEEELSSAVKRTAKDVLRSIKTKNLSFTLSSWMVGSLIQSMNDLLVREPEVTEFENVEIVSISDDDMEEMMLMLNTTSIELNMDLEADMEDQSEAGDLFDSIMFDDEVLAQLDLFSYNNHEENPYAFDKWRMPQTNMFYENINQLSRIQFGNMNFKSVVKMFRENSGLQANGFLGHLLCFFTGRVCFPSQMTETDARLMNLQLDTVSLTTSLRSEMDLEALNVEEIDKNIAYLRSQLTGAPQLMRDSMVQQLSKLERIKTLRVISPTNPESLEKHLAIDVITKLKPQILALRELPETFQSLDDSVFCVVVRNELDSEIDKMAQNGDLTPLEQSLFREANSKHYVTSMLLDSLTYRFKIGITMSGYQTKGLSYVSVVL